MAVRRKLLAWIAWYKDYRLVYGEREEVNPQGPSFDACRHFFDPQVHEEFILLSSEEDKGMKSLQLYSDLRREFTHIDIQIRFLDLRDIFDFQELKAKTGKVLQEFAEQPIDIIFSNGTTPMRMVWVLHHLEGRQPTRLVQGMDSRMTESDPRFQVITLNEETFPYRLEARVQGQQSKDLFISETLKPLYERAEKIALAHDPRVSVLIRGESGSGKERLAVYIHAHSARKNEPFVALNCAAIPEALVESMLFGHTKGSFTGAERNRKGHFEQAHKGILFLDEIGDASSHVQEVLLRVIQEKKIRPVGGKERQIDVRIIAATNRDLESRCEAGEFRWDLYWRINTAELVLPGLSAYPVEDLRDLFAYLLQKKAHASKRKVLAFSAEVEQYLLAYDFPGNVRELENIISYGYIFAQQEITWEDLPDYLLRKSTLPISLKLEAVEKKHILKVWEIESHNLSRTAKTLGISLNTLKSRLREYGVYP
ncbi:MAG: sigma 54-interacting transcriptional regulator [Bacteroidota bacterium]